MISVEGYLNKVIFHNKENNYYILSIFLEHDYDFIEGDYLSVVGTFESIDFVEEELYSFKGNIVTHKKYGVQLAAIMAERVIKKDTATIISYLSSDTFQGVGKKTAELIVTELGVDCLDKIYEDKNQLFKIKGIPKARKDVIYNTIISNKHTQDIILKLSEYNLSNNIISKIYAKYKSQTLEIINSNPYYIIKDINGINFNTVDKIAEKLGIPSNDLERIAAALTFTLTTYCYSSGHTFIKKNNLLYNTFNVLYAARKEELKKEDILDGLQYCIEENKLFAQDDNIFLPEIHHSEFSIYDNITLRLNEHNEDDIKIDDVLFEKYIDEIEDELNITYDIDQIAAIKNSIESNFSIVTGGPGTGKTTIILGIIRIFQKINNLSYADLTNEEKNYITLCAPTGKAAKRMTESTGFAAATIHKTIGWTAEDDDMKNFQSEKFIKSKLVIIDEASMIDVFLMNNLLKTISNQSKIVLVGDDEQLPSIAPGNVLNDLINSNKIATVSLNKIFRQGQDSSIINLSHAIKNDINIDVLENFHDREFLLANKADILKVIVETYAGLLNETSRDKIQILIPIYKSNYGINEVNKLIQENFNSEDVHIEYGDGIYKINDRVMQLVNRPEDNIFNGDIGIIENIYKEEGKMKIAINYDGNIVIYEKVELSQIILAYACSIHKSQGSEFDFVIIPLVDSYNFMFNKNLIYTAITRTKKKLFFCGNPKVFYLAIDPLNVTTRYSYLKNFFEEDAKSLFSSIDDFILTPQNINFIDPMIGMEDITPYTDFNE